MTSKAMTVISFLKKTRVEMKYLDYVSKVIKESEKCRCTVGIMHAHRVPAASPSNTVT